MGPVVDKYVVDEHCRGVPAEPLRRYVAWYTGYRQRGVRPARHRGLPSPYLTLIFTLDEPLTMMAHPDPGQPPGEFGTLLGGLHCTPALIVHEGAQSGIQVALRPLGARALLGLPAGELADIDVPAEAVLGGVCAELRDRVRAADGWSGRFAILDEILLRLATSNLAVACGYFDQAHLAREFRSLAGCPPSQWLAEEFRNVQAGAWLAEGAWEDRSW